MKKKLLVLGTSVGSVDIVQYAKSMGHYTVVADYLDPEKSAAKKAADESIMLSTADTDALIDYAKSHGITAVFAGVSEFNLESARKVNEALGNSFYYTSEQWALFMNKGHFRNLCRKYGVKTPETFFIGCRDEWTADVKNNISFPVIVKPVDCGANVGISICRERETLEEGVSLAFASSKSGRIIIEQFVEGPEISTTYVIQDHVCKLVCMGTKYAYKNEKGLQALAHGYIYPSPNLGEYLESTDEVTRKMILESGINNCTIFFQGIYSDHAFYIFEAGLRLEGTATFRITEFMHGQSFMKFMVDTLLGEKTTYNVNKEDPSFGGRKCFIFSLISKEGIVSRTAGFEKIQADPSIIASEQRHFVGDAIKNDGTLRQIMFRFVIRNDNIDEVIQTIHRIKDTIKVYDTEGNSMLIQSFDPEILKN